MPTIKQRVISYGEHMNLKRLQALTAVKNKRQSIRARKLAKLSTDSLHDNDV